MPVPQENLLFVEQASCLFRKGLLRMIQNLSYNQSLKVAEPLVGIAVSRQISRRMPIAQNFPHIQKTPKLATQTTKLEIAEQNTAIIYFLSPTMSQTLENLTAIDDNLSKRHIDLDPGGYFIIYVDRETSLICAKHFTNIIDDRGIAIDPETGKPIPARGKVERTEVTLFTARTAKELCVKILEETRPNPVTMLDHAAYLGREFLRAEIALLSDREYVQD